MTATPSSPSELFAMNTKQVFAEGLTPTEVVEKLFHHSEFQPSELVELMKGVTQKLYNFHLNVTKQTVEENGGALPQDELFWAVDATKLEAILYLMEGI